MNRRVDLNQHRFRWSAVLWTVGALILSGTSGCAATSSYRDIRPPCEAPALLQGKFDSRAPSFLIRLRPVADVTSVARDLAIRYGVALRPVFSAGSTIITVGSMTPETVAALRCDPAVEAISHDAVLEHVI